MTSRATLQRIFYLLGTSYDVTDWWHNESPLEIVLGAILVQNTAWANANIALRNLIRSEVISIEKLNEIELEELQRLIRPAGFYRAKSNTMKAFAEMVISTNGGNLEELLRMPTATLGEKLVSVKGIGNETADDIALYAGNKPVFVIDKYTIRILERYGIGIDTRTSSYLRWQALFHDNLDSDTHLFQDFHGLFVAVAQDVCKTIPICSRCVLKNECSTGLKMTS